MISAGIVTFDEVPPYLSRTVTRTTCAARMQDPRNVGENLKRVPPKSLPTALTRGCPQAKGGPQGPRRPRFSFFRFTCQTAREPQGFPSPTLRGSRRSPRRQTGAGRLVTLSVRSFAGAPSRRKVGGAPSWGLYRGGPGPLSTDILNEFQHRRALWIVPSAQGWVRTCI